MKLKKIFSSVITAVLLLTTLTACNSGGNSSSDNSQSSTVESGGNSSDNSAENSSDNTNNESETSAPESVKITALKGPTAMGMTKLMNDNESEKYGYEFEILAAPDEITPLVAAGKTDIACIPANLGSVLYNRTDGGVQALAVNTLGVLYICENGDTVHSAEDLRGKTIYSSGKGATPEYSLNFILKSNNIDPEKDVTIEWKSEHTECLQALLTTENSVALLPQPFVTTAQNQNGSVRVALDLNDEWYKLNVDSSLITGIVIVRREFAEQYPAAVDEFLKRYGDSVDYVNANIEDAAQLIEKYDIVKVAVAQKALPNCHIVCITGGDLKDALSGYLEVLYDGNPQSVGGALPGEDFYY